MNTTSAAPNRPRPTVNIPATPPVRNAIRIAGCSPPSRAAAATRTLPRVHSVIPTNPVTAENTAPTRKKMLRPQRTPAPSAGSRSRMKKMAITKMPRVWNWRRRYAAAPSWTARAISCIFWVPWLAASTSLTSTPATPSASRATTATMTTQVRLEPLTVTGSAASAGTSLDIRPPGSRFGITPSAPIGKKRVAGVYAGAGATTNTWQILTDLLPFRYLSDAVTPQALAAVDGQLIRTLTPELVDETRTSSARPEITARPNPEGIAIAPSSPFGAAAAGAPGGGTVGAASRTTTTNRSPWLVISILTGSAGQSLRCTSTAREQASPTARRTSSSSASSTPLRLATAVATRRAVRTCAGSGVNATSTVAISDGPDRALLLGFLGRDGQVHRLVDAEHLRQTGDPEDLEYPLLGAHEVERAIVSPHSLQPSHQHPESRRVEELDLLHIHDELVVVLVHQVDEQLTE